MLNWYFKTLFKSFSFEITHKIALRCPYFCDLPRFCVLAPDFNWSCRDLIIQSFPIVQNIYNLLWSCGLGTWLQLDLDRFNCSKLKLVNLFIKLIQAANDLAIFCDLVLWLHLDLSIIGKKKLREDENLIYRPSPAIAISFFCRDVPCSTMGRAGDHPGIDEGGNCKRAKLSFAAGDQTEPFFWMKFLNSFLIFYNNFPHHSAIHITWSIRPTESKSGCEVAATTFPSSSSSRLFFSRNSSIRLDWYLWEEQLASTGLRSNTLWLWPLARNIWKWF